jgi:large subunit ribosomal protein L29
MNNPMTAAKAAIRNRPTSEQRVELLKLRKEQFALRVQRVTGQAVRPDQFGKVRKKIARLKTAIRAQAGSGPAVAAKASGGKR